MVHGSHSKIIRIQFLRSVKRKKDYEVSVQALRLFNQLKQWPLLLNSH